MTGTGGRFDLSGRIALITGGTRGLGRAIAEAFAAAGAGLVVVGRRAEACERAAAELTAAVQGRVRVTGMPCHVGRWDELGDLAEAVYREFGKVDVLVNNAGISPLYGRLSEVTEEHWDKVIAVNLKGPFRLSALIGERMADGAGGSIINVSSTGSVRPTADIAVYAAAKAGLNAMTVALAGALGPSVRVNTIMPGPFLTDIARDWDPELLVRRTRTFPLRRAGRAEEIAGAALYLASDASSFTTGSVLTVDGGAQWSMPGTGDDLAAGI